jgi:hypothetical protein
MRFVGVVHSPARFAGYVEHGCRWRLHTLVRFCTTVKCIVVSVTISEQITKRLAPRLLLDKNCHSHLISKDGPVARGSKTANTKAKSAKGSNGANLGFEEKLWQAADKLRGTM